MRSAMRRARAARARLAILSLCALSCSSLKPLPPGAHVVPAPISKRANVVLKSCVEEYGSSDGRWRGSLSGGCTPIWAAQFGYRAGVRRNRQDVVAIGRATSEQVSRAILKRGGGPPDDFDRDADPIYGFPALLVSAALGGRNIDGVIVAHALDRLGEIDQPGPRVCAGLAALLAEVSVLDPPRREERLRQAREYAAQIGAAGDPTWTFFARAAIALASGEEADLALAREAERATGYEFDPGTGAFRPPDTGREILSVHLVMAHGYADVAQASADAASRAHAVALLDYVFSDAYFNGRFLAHDRLEGSRSDAVCSGCNLMALYLVDRLYGDSFGIDPVPALPKRDWPEERPFRSVSPEGPDCTLAVRSKEGGLGEPERTLTHLAPRGRILLVHGILDAQVRLDYIVQSAEERAPSGGIRLRAQAEGKDAKLVGNTYVFTLGFEPDGVARLGYAPDRSRQFYGLEPLLWYVEFARGKDGSLSALIALKEHSDPVKPVAPPATGASGGE